MHIITVSAVLFQRLDGTVLTVRKRGTDMFMLPGGKPEPGEDPRGTAVREFSEELGVDLDEARLRYLGDFRCAAANEPGHEVLAHVYEHPFVPVDQPRAEIERLEWVDPAAEYRSPTGATMAPLNTDHVFPALVRERTS